MREAFDLELDYECSIRSNMIRLLNVFLIEILTILDLQLRLVDTIRFHCDMYILCY